MRKKIMNRQPKLWENIILEEGINLSIAELKILNRKLSVIIQKKTELKKYGQAKTNENRAQEHKTK